MTMLWLFIYALNGIPQVNWGRFDGWALTLAICVGIDLAKILFKVSL